MDLPYETTDDRPLQIGLIVLQSDETIEPDMRRLMPDDVELLVSRVPSGTHVTSESLAEMETVMTDAAQLLPSGARFSAIGYGCTSGTAEIGAARVASLIKMGAATPVVTEPVSALIAVCDTLSIDRLGIVSPYVESVSKTLQGVLEANGVAVTSVASFNQSEEEKVARISPRSVLDATKTLASSTDCDAVFLSCTNLRTLDVIEAAEDAINKPVLTSNQVLAWHLLRLTGVAGRSNAPGLLWRTSVEARQVAGPNVFA